MVGSGPGGASAAVVSRGAELRRIDSLLDAIGTNGRPTVALVSGAAGVGKSRLVQETVARAAARGTRTSVGRCVEFGAEIWPLAPAREIVAALATELPPATFATVLGPEARLLGALMPELDTAGAPSDRAPPAGAQSTRAFAVVLRRVAALGTRVVVFEDLHWADESTRQLFSLLTCAGGLDPLFVLGTYRSDELDRHHPLRHVLGEILRSARPERFDLEPLDRMATAELITLLMSEPPDATLVDEVYRLSGGYPFFVEELVASRAAGFAGLPETLREVILGRVSTLDDPTLEVLRVTAASHSVATEVLGAVCGLDRSSLGVTLDTATAASLLVRDGDDVRFRHDLAREVLYGDLDAGERPRIHRRLAERLEACQPLRSGELARHWAAAGDDERTLAWSVRAGRDLLRAGAAAEAEGHLRRSLELWDRVADPARLAGTGRADLLLDAASAAKHAGHLTTAIEYSHSAVALLADDPSRAGDVWIELRDLYRFSGRGDECTDAVERALALLPVCPPTASRAVALSNAALEMYYIGKPAETLALAHKALAVAEVAGDANAVVYARNAVGAAMFLAGPNDELLPYNLATVAMCGPDVSPERTLTALNGLANVLTGLGCFADTVPVARRGVAIARETGLGGPRGSLMAWWWVFCLIELGRWDEVEPLLDELHDLIERPLDDSSFAATWGPTLVRQGRLQAALPYVDWARADNERESGSDHLAYSAAAVLEFDIATQRDVDVVGFVDGVLDRIVATRRHGVYELLALAIGALADRGPPNRPAAQQLVDVALGWMRRVEGTGGDLAYDLAERLAFDRAEAEIGGLAGTPDASKWLRLAELAGAHEMRYDESYARWRAAGAHLAGVAGRSSAARHAAAAELAVARSLAEGLAAAPLLADIEALVAQARLDLGPFDRTAAPARSGSGAADRNVRGVHDDDHGDLGHRHDDDHDGLGLTSRELEVLRLVADGRSNAQIGRTLFISTKTASVHVSNILRKLEVTNRVEAGTIARHQWHD